MVNNVSPISVARRLRELELFYFSPASLAALLSLDKATAYRAVARLRAVGLAAEVEKGKYILLGLEPERVLSNSLFVASHLVAPAYISYWSALHFHGLTSQVPRTVFVATTKKKRPVTFRGQTFRYVTLRPRKLFGYCRETIGDLPALVADEAKAIVDSLDQPRYAGGLIEVGQALRNALPALDLDLLVDYAVRMEDRSLASRLGYLLDSFGHSVAGLPISQNPIALDPHRPAKGEIDPHWRVTINVPIDELAASGVG